MERILPGNKKEPLTLEKMDQVERFIKKSSKPKEKTKYAIVTASSLNLRSSPTIKKNILKVLSKDTHLLSLSFSNNSWIKVKTPYEKTGWVYKKYVKLYQPKSLPKLNIKNTSDNTSSILEASIIKYIKEANLKNKLNKDDKLSIIIQDLESNDHLVSIDPRKILKSASTIKVPILHAYMIQRFRGIIEESKWHKKRIEEMIRYSSNPSTNTIIHLLGGTKNIQKILENTNIYLDTKLIENFPLDGRAYQNKISVSDLNQIFVYIWKKNIPISKNDPHINSKISKEITDLLSLPGHSWLKDRIKSGTCFSTKKSVKIWDKTGFVKGANGNAAIIEIDTPYGRKAYSIVLFFERKNYKSIKGEAKDWFEKTSSHMRRISEMTYAFFSNRYKSFYKCGDSLLNHYIKLILNT